MQAKGNGHLRLSIDRTDQTDQAAAIKAQKESIKNGMQQLQGTATHLLFHAEEMVDSSLKFVSQAKHLVKTGEKLVTLGNEYQRVLRGNADASGQGNNGD